MERRLAAVLAADIVGYSRMMDIDETRTITLVNQLLADVIYPIIDRHGGRVFKTLGDGLLAEFSSVVGAVNCAYSWQRAIGSAQAGENDFSILFRMGISLGEVVVQGDDLFGTGVNIAARLEGIAAPGTICVTADVHAQSAGRVEMLFDDLGERQLKNISGPHRVYSISVHAHEAALTGTLLDRTGLQDDPARRQADPTRDGSDAPSLAVLPFVDMATQAPNKLLAEGFSEEIIATLSRTRWLFLIAAGSSAAFGGGNVDVRTIAAELGVRYILQGQFMATADRVRVTAALIDGDSGARLRSFRSDRAIEDPFQVIDDISFGVVGELLPEISQRERTRIRRKRDGDLTSWELYLRGLDFLRHTTPEACIEAAGLLVRALEMQPDLAIAHARRATCAIHQGYFGWGDRPLEVVAAEAMEHATKALEIDPDEALACDALASAYQLVRNFSEAEYWARKAIDLNPTCVAAYGTLVTVLAMNGDAEEAIAFYEQLERTSPRDPDVSSAVMGACMAYFCIGDMEAAAQAARKHSIARPNWYGNRIFLAASLGHLGNEDLSRQAVEKILELEPTMTLRAHRDRTALRRPEHVELLIEGLRLAGLPE